MNTPFFLVNKEKIYRNYKTLQEKMPVDYVYYATKPNNERITIQTIRRMNGLYEIVSSAEMKYLLSIGVKANRVICSLPIKKEEEISTLYNFGCRYFVFDCLREYKKLCRLSPTAKKIARLSISDISDNDIGFGLTMEQMIEIINKGIIPDGYTFYLLNHERWEEKLEIIFSRIQELLELHKNRKPIIINIGGNYPLPTDENICIYNKLKDLITKMKNKYRNICFIAEPGRSVVNDAFTLITTVLDVRGNDVYLDAHSQILKIAPKFVDTSSKKRFCNKHKVKFYESLCSRYALFEMEIDFEIEVGMRLELMNCGAYSICFANNFHSTGKPAISIV